MTRGMRRIASIDIWEDGHVDVYMVTFPGSDKLTNKDWEWIWPIRKDVKSKFLEMMNKVRNHE